MKPDMSALSEQLILTFIHQERNYVNKKKCPGARCAPGLRIRSIYIAELCGAVPRDGRAPCGRTQRFRDAPTGRLCTNDAACGPCDATSLHTGGMPRRRPWRVGEGWDHRTPSSRVRTIPQSRLRVREGDHPP